MKIPDGWHLSKRLSENSREYVITLLQADEINDDGKTDNFDGLHKR